MLQVIITFKCWFK